MFGIDVATIEPGPIATALIAKPSGGIGGIEEIDDRAALHEPGAGLRDAGAGLDSGSDRRRPRVACFPRP